VLIVVNCPAVKIRATRTPPTPRTILPVDIV
jgi:hypothetical protein